MSESPPVDMQIYIAELKHARHQVETAKPFKKAEAAARLFVVMIDTLELIDARLAALEGAR